MTISFEFGTAVARRLEQALQYWELLKSSNPLARVVVDNAIHRINHNPVDSVVCYRYLLDNDLSYIIQPSHNLKGHG